MSSYRLLIMWFFFSSGSGSYLFPYRVCLFVFVCLFVGVFVCLFGFLKSKNWVLTFYLSCDFFQKDRALTFFLTVFVCLMGCLFVCWCVCFFRFLKSKNWVLTFFLTLGIFIFKVRIEFLLFSLPCDHFYLSCDFFQVLIFYLTLGIFWKVRIEFLLFSLPCEFFFSKVRIEFLSFSLPCLFVCLSVCLFGFLKSKNWVLTFYLSFDFFFKRIGLFFPFFLLCLCLFVWLFLWFCLFVCLGFWKERIEFVPFTYHVIFFFKS